MITPSAKREGYRETRESWAGHDIASCDEMEVVVNTASISAALATLALIPSDYLSKLVARVSTAYAGNTDPAILEQLELALSHLRALEEAHPAIVAACVKHVPDLKAVME